MMVISSLGYGGAEAMLYKLLCHMKRDGISLVVVSLTNTDGYGKDIKKLGVKVCALSMTKSFKFISAMRSYRRLVKAERPDVILSWMYHANLVCSIYRLIFKGPKIIWNIRQDLSDVGHEKYTTRLTRKLNCHLSKSAHAVVNNCRTSIEQHKLIGLENQNTLYIPNGFELAEFKIRDEMAAVTRNDLGLKPDCVLVGFFARYVPVKNHNGALHVFKLLKDARSGPIKFILAGEGVTEFNMELKKTIEQLSLQNDCFLLGHVSSKHVLPSLNVFISPSWSEGFPNVIGEAMACGVYCVASDVGDCNEIIGSTGAITAPGDYNSMAEACLKRIENSKSPSKEDIRKRIELKYNITNIGNEYMTLLLETCIA